jgi:hypothetical protein
MTLAFIIYLIQFLDSIKVAAIITGVAFLVLAVVYFMAWVDAGPNATVSKSNKSDGSGEMLVFHAATRFMGFVKRFVSYAVIAAACAILIPSQRTAYMMAAGYVTQAIAESPAAAEIGNKVLRLINVRLDTMINDELDNLTKSERKDGAGQAVKTKN